jgi:hypothetical protein
MQLIPMKGKRFGSLVVLRKFPDNRKYGRKRTYWLCQCDCGKRTSVDATSLRISTKSCGCGRRVSHFKHGMGGKKIRRTEYSLLVNAKQRAKNRNKIFTLKIEDIKIPAICPVLGIPLFKGTGMLSDNSPTIDEIQPGKGYTVKNTEIISYRANRLKSDSTIEEIEKILEYMRKNADSAIDEASFGEE